METLRIGIVGCGKIADQHALTIDRLEGCKIVALCDREILMARQLGERIKVDACYSDLAEMLAENSLDAVHITTPPQGHYALAKQCLDAECHVYLEKPFTVTAEEAGALLDLAVAKNLILTAGHNYQFTPEMLEMRAEVADQFLGGNAVHLESYWTYDLGDRSYVGPLLGNRDHWVRRLPGQLFHNLISHGIARIAEFLDDEWEEVTASAWQSPLLGSYGGEEVQDELRVMIRDCRGTSAFFCFSTQIKPGKNTFRICGPENSLFVDIGSGCLIRDRKGNNKSYLTFVVPPLRAAIESLRNARRNIGTILGRKLYHDSGMTELIRQFHESIRSAGSPPIPYREIRLTARLMDEIFSQITPHSRPQFPEKVLVSTL